MSTDAFGGGADELDAPEALVPEQPLNSTTPTTPVSAKSIKGDRIPANVPNASDSAAQRRHGASQHCLGQVVGQHRWSCAGIGDDCDERDVAAEIGRHRG